MSTNAVAGSSIRTIREWKRCLPTEHLVGISAMTSVNADRNRIYQALTVPEYIEAWLSVPCRVAGRSGVPGAEDFSSIDFGCTLHAHCRIFCSYKVRRRSKLVFTWQHLMPAEATSSMVKIRLLGDFGRTTVHVTHVGLTLSDEQWHEDLWTSSLLKLSKLF